MGIDTSREVSTPKTRFCEPQFSEILNLMNKLQIPFSYFTLYPDLIYSSAFPSLSYYDGNQG